MRFELGLSVTSGCGALLQGIRMADAQGLDGVWLTDQKLWRDGYALLGAAAAVAPRLHLAVGVSDPFSRHPAELACAAATLSELGGGGFTLGLGSGGGGLDALGVQKRKGLSVVEAAVRAIRALWQGEAVSETSDAFVLREARLRFPVTQPPDILVVAHGPRMYRLAGRVADVAAVANYACGAGIDWARSQIDAGARERAAELPPIRTILRLDCAIGSAEEGVRDVIRRRVEGFLDSGYYGPTFLAPIGLEHLATRGGRSDADIESLIDRVALTGTLDECVEKLRRLGAADGVWEGICLSLYLGAGQDIERGVSQVAELAGRLTAERTMQRGGVG